MTAIHQKRLIDKNVPSLDQAISSNDKMKEFYSDLDRMINSITEKYGRTGQRNPQFVWLPDLPMSECIKHCNLNIDGPLISMDFGFDLRTYAECSLNSKYDKQFISFAPWNTTLKSEFKRALSIPEVHHFYRKYFKGFWYNAKLNYLISLLTYQISNTLSGNNGSVGKLSW